ncbi:Os01g0956300 [Oryza sativa Japonica Group]|uniref:Os01g0956300 protein n=2 Tax=Oryza sativa subsp. japonica TaxID=39947 RepID=Q0JFX5_ORYSJ|nr:hypothetical protein EE612_008066 [Oryza sativa]BAF07353.1 Os01g0956300 [Oryza sativa Japonica Group]BAS76286.1 Os01g0956300 [Oryza sativa Japonica Group]|eukprot:NP_001045439.1 Os01g0956300 [Oryza sativa Japonica Group]
MTRSGASCRTSHRWPGSSSGGAIRSRTSSTLLMMSASHLRVYGRILSSTVAFAAGGCFGNSRSDRDDGSVRTSPAMKQTSVLKSERSQQMVSPASDEHGERSWLSRTTTSPAL